MELAEALQEINFGEKERAKAFDLAEEREVVMHDQGKGGVDHVSFSLPMDFEQKWVMAGDFAFFWKCGVMKGVNVASLILSPRVEDYDELQRHGENGEVRMVWPKGNVTSEAALYDEELGTP